MHAISLLYVCMFVPFYNIKKKEMLHWLGKIPLKDVLGSKPCFVIIKIKINQTLISQVENTIVPCFFPKTVYIIILSL